LGSLRGDFLEGSYFSDILLNHDRIGFHGVQKNRRRGVLTPKLPSGYTPLNELQVGGVSKKKEIFLYKRREGV